MLPESDKGRKGETGRTVSQGDEGRPEDNGLGAGERGGENTERAIHAVSYQSFDNAVANESGSLAEGQAGSYEKHYGDFAARLTAEVEVTALTPLGERTLTTDKALWDTGATNTVIHIGFANRLGILPMPKMDGEGNMMALSESHHIGTATVRIRIGSAMTPLGVVNVSDFDPDGINSSRGFDIPDMLLGMDVINLGRFCVDSTSGETVVRFEI